MSITKENPNPVPRAPTEPKGKTVEPSSAPAAPAASAEPAPAPRVRGFAPPIIDTLPSAPAGAAAVPAMPVKLPKLWLAFHSDGKALYCTGALQRDQVQRLQFDPRDPIIAQAYAYFVQQMVRLLDGGAPAVEQTPAEPAPAEPAPAEPAPAEPVDPKTVPLAELKTRRDTEPPHRSLRSSQVQRLEQKPAEQKADDDVVPPTNPNPDRVK